MALQEGDHVRLQCEDCYRPLGRFQLFHHHGEGPLLLGDAVGAIRSRNPTPEQRQRGYRGRRRGRVWKYDNDQNCGIRYRYECRCGRTILLSTARVQRLAAARSPGEAVFLV